MRDKATSPLLKDALWYTAAAGAVLAPSAAGAQVIYTDLDPGEAVIDTEVGGDGVWTGFSIDFDGDGDHEVLFFEEEGRDYTRFAYDVDPSDGPDALTGVVGELIPFGGGGLYLYPSPLATGSVIGPGPNLVTDTAYTYGTFTFEGSDPENWRGVDAYLGVRFTLNGTETHYGWVEIEVPQQGGAIIVKGYAFESSPDTPIEAGDTGTVAIEPGPDGRPGTHALSAAFPNPAAGRAQVTLEVAQTQAVRVVVYDARGREVATLHDGPLAAGREHVLTFDGARLRSGVYVVRVIGETFTDTRTVAIVR